MAMLKACDVCGIPGPKGSPNPVVRFGLRRAAPAEKLASGKWRSRTHSVGSIDLCRECWEKIAKPRIMRQKVSKRHLRLVDAEGSERAS